MIALRMAGDQQLRSVGSLVGLALLAIMFAAGCGSSSEPAGGVLGMVTIDGQPATDGTISFVPVGQKYPTVMGSIVDGRYKQSVPSGAYKVMISSHRVVGEARVYDSPDSPMRKITEEILPPRYNDQTELQIEIGPKEMEYNFDLSSK